MTGGLTRWRAWTLIALMAMVGLGASWEATPKESIADAIVVLVPTTDLALHIPVDTDRIISGVIIARERAPRRTLTIVHAANTFTTPLRQGVPTRLYLKRYLDRDAYYVIGVLPLDGTGEDR